MNNKSITKRDEDFAKWYTDIVKAAKLCSYSSVKGFITMEPNGYAIWEMMQKTLDKMFKETNHQNVYMPLLIPEGLLNKEKELVEGFAPEVAWVTHGGDKKFDERLCIRPTSETLFSEYFKEKTNSYRDLPIKLNQWCSVVRWEKETRPFLRGREFLWQEGHTIHETKKEGEEETLNMLNVYKDFMQQYLAIPVITGKKTEKEKFAGAEYTYTVEALMYNGVVLQMGTSHFFGQKFSKAYDIKYLNKDNQQDYPYQTSWGVTTRMIGGLIMVHADDLGLVLPPKIAPKVLSVIEIGQDDEVKEFIKNLEVKLKENNISYYVDDTLKSPGFKFAESEVNGIPLRLEVGKRDLSNNQLTIVRRDTLEKININVNDDIILIINNLLEDIQNNLYNKALQRQNDKVFKAYNLEEVEKLINKQPGYIHACWCGNKECEEKMKEIKGIKSRCIPFEENKFSDKCVVCGKEAKHEVIWGVQY